jgi:hypothetical protein
LSPKRLDMLDWELNFNARVILESFRTSSHLSTGCKGHIFLLMHDDLQLFSHIC